MNKDLMIESYFQLKYGARIEAVVTKNQNKIPINKNYIVEKLKKNNLEYDTCLKAFNEKYPDYEKHYKNYYNEQRADFFSNPEKLIKWFKDQQDSCGYCGVSQANLRKIAEIRGTKDKPNLTLNGKTKRSKGTLEIEKKDPNKGYTYENCILACPLCNNAKSNLIDEESWKNLFVKPMQEYYRILLKENN